MPTWKGMDIPHDKGHMLGGDKAVGVIFLRPDLKMPCSIWVSKNTMS
jgi:hypothetical protein